MKITETKLKEYIENSLKTHLYEANGQKLPYNPKDPNNIVSLEYDPNTKFGKDWGKTRGNFAVKRGGQVFYVSRSTSMIVYAFCKNRNDEWCVLAVKRGPKAHGGNGMFAIPGGYLDMSYTTDDKGIRQYETLEMGAVREIKEETGVKIDPSKLDKYSVDSSTKDIHVCFTAILDGFVDQYPTSTANCEAGEIDAAIWIPFSKLDKVKWSWNQGAKALGIAKTVIGDYENPNEDKVETIVAQLKQEIGQNQRGQLLLKKLLDTIQIKQ